MFGSMCVVYIHDTHVCCVQHCIGYGRSRIVWVRGVAQATPHFSILEGVGGQELQSGRSDILTSVID